MTAGTSLDGLPGRAVHAWENGLVSGNPAWSDDDVPQDIRLTRETSLRLEVEPELMARLEEAEQHGQAALLRALDENGLTWLVDDRPQHTAGHSVMFGFESDLPGLAHWSDPGPQRPPGPLPEDRVEARRKAARRAERKARKASRRR